MIVIEPVGVQSPLFQTLPFQSFQREALSAEELPQRDRYPKGFQMPILIPKSIIPDFRMPPEHRSAWWALGLLAGLVALTKEAPAPGLGYIPKRETGARSKSPNKLLWMWVPPGKFFEDAVAIPRSKVREYQAKAVKSRGRLYYIFAESANRARYLLRQDPTSYERWKTPAEIRQVERSAGASLPTAEAAQLQLFGQAPLSGRIANCAIWIPNERGGWKCGMYGRVCDSPTCSIVPDPNLLKQIKTCVKKQHVFSPFLNREVIRCKRYESACTGPSCMSEPMPYPKTETERSEPTATEIRSIADWMAAEYNAETFNKQPFLAREILSRGGISPPKKSTATGITPGKEEYLSIPLFLRNKRGLPLDEMASEMKFDYEEDLREALLKQYPPKKTGAYKKLTRKTWKDFQDDAYEMIEAGLESGTWSDLGGTREDFIDSLMPVHKASGSWRYMWEDHGKKPKQVTPEEDYRLQTKAKRGTMWLVRARSADEARRLIAEGKVKPYWREDDLSGLGQDLFPGLRRELVLDPPDDIATSDDPVTACMERLGWRVPRMQALRSSISEKLTPDLFTGKTRKLSAGEKEYQRVISECLAARSGTAGLGDTKRTSGFVRSRSANIFDDARYDTKAMSRYLKEAGVKVNKDQTVTLYHGTTKANAERILKQGKIEGTSSKNVMQRVENAAWLTPNREYAKIWGDKILTLKVPVSYIRHMPKNFKEFYFEGGLKRINGTWIPKRKPKENWVITVARADLDAYGEAEQLPLFGSARRAKMNRFGALADPPDPWMTAKPFTPEEEQRYKDYVGNQDFNVLWEFTRRVEEREFNISQRMQSRNMTIRPRHISDALSQYRRALYLLFKMAPRNPGRMDELMDLVDDADKFLRKRIGVLRKAKPLTGKAFQESKRSVLTFLIAEPGERHHIDAIQRRLNMEYHHVNAALKSLIDDKKVTTQGAMMFSWRRGANTEPEQLQLLGGKKGHRYKKGSLDSAINAALKTVDDKPLYIFPTYYGFKIDTSVPSWLNHVKVHQDGTVSSHVRDLRSGKWTIEKLERRLSPGTAPQQARPPQQEPEQLRFLGSGTIGQRAAL